MVEDYPVVPAGASLTPAVDQRQEDSSSAVAFVRSPQLPPEVSIGQIGAWEWVLPIDRIVRTPTCASLIAPTPNDSPSFLSDDLFGFLSHVYADDRSKVQDAIRATIWGGRDYRVDYRVVCEDGTTRWLRDEGDLFRDEAGEAERLVGTTTAIGESAPNSSEAGRLELPWRASATTAPLCSVSDTLSRLRRNVSESSHRIKNHLQVLAAMADLATMDGAESVPAEAVKRLAAQIQALASVHDFLSEEAKSDTHLTDSPETRRFHTRTLLERVLALLRENLAGRIQLSAEIDDTPLNAEQATAVALLVNELVSNAAKHGAKRVSVLFGLSQIWPEERERRSARRACLEVHDNGPGFPKEFDPARHANTGVEIVQSLALWDLSGTLTFTNLPEGGANVRVEFPLCTEPGPHLGSEPLP